MSDATDRDTSLCRGARVRVRCAAGRIAHDVVWQDFGDVAMVCGPAQFERLAGGHQAPMPIGFKREDVELVASL